MSGFSQLKSLKITILTLHAHNVHEKHYGVAGIVPLVHAGL